MQVFLFKNLGVLKFKVLIVDCPKLIACLSSNIFLSRFFIIKIINIERKDF